MLKAELKHIKDFYWSKRTGRGSIFDLGPFASVVPYGDKYVGACRNGSAGLGDMVAVINFDSNLDIISQHEITKGEDPRVFLYNQEPHAITWDPSPNPQGPGNVFYYKVINLISGVVKTLQIENVPLTRVETLGKNWMPLVKDNELYIVLTIEPHLCVLHCNLSQSKCSWVTPYELVKDGLSITYSRGGTPFIYHEEHGCYFGLGHRTYNCHYHTPFLYTVSNDFGHAYIGPDLLTSRIDGVSDPLSIFKRGEKYYCCIAHCPEQLGDTREATSALYEVIVS